MEPARASVRTCEGPTPSQAPALHERVELVVASLVWSIIEMPFFIVLGAAR